MRQYKVFLYSCVAVDENGVSASAVREFVLSKFSEAESEDVSLLLDGMLASKTRLVSRYNKIRFAPGLVNPETDASITREFETFLSEHASNNSNNHAASLEKALNQACKVIAKAKVAENETILLALHSRMKDFAKNWEKQASATSPEEKRGRPKANK